MLLDLESLGIGSKTKTNNLKFHSFAIEFDGPDFLEATVSPVSIRHSLVCAKAEGVPTKSTPMVEMYDSVYVSSANRRSKQDFPTPESPIRRSLKR